jgi:hypothetical protein
MLSEREFSSIGASFHLKNRDLRQKVAPKVHQSCTGFAPDLHREVKARSENRIPMTE